MEKVFAYIEENEKRFLDELFDLLRVQSISAKFDKDDTTRECGKMLVEKLKKIGMENAAVIETTGLPVVYADWLNAGDDKPTIMFYGHFDVQPAEPLDKWDTEPFEPVVKDGWIYGRGANDNKGQLYTHIAALESIMKIDGKLPVNVKVFLESEEEGGRGGTEKFVHENTKLLACDAVAISDTSWPNDKTPTILYGMRGIAYFQVDLKGPNRDLHSGMYGGKVQNPLNAMAYITGKLHDEDGRIAIPGIYDDVQEMNADEREEFKTLGNSDEQLMADLGVNSLWGEKGFTSNERNWARPAFDINGMWGGYMEEGQKTVIPSEAGFKISMRLVPDQSPERVKELLSKYIEEICPPGIEAKVSLLHGGSPVSVDRKDPFISCAMDAIETAFGKRPILIKEGASVPITATFQQLLNAEPILMGFGLDEDNIHSPNEKFKLSHFNNGMKAAAAFYLNADKVKK
jgi:acetylornithine deacetylase/succinyl-diaminopimelate desuccinylase-like protein